MEVMTTERSATAASMCGQWIQTQFVAESLLVIQVKRYRSTIPPAPVRDLYGRMLHEGATKGIRFPRPSSGRAHKSSPPGNP